jgi:hypothetical protein
VKNERQRRGRVEAARIARHQTSRSWETTRRRSSPGRRLAEIELAAAELLVKLAAKAAGKFVVNPLTGAHKIPQQLRQARGDEILRSAEVHSRTGKIILRRLAHRANSTVASLSALIAK